MIDFKIVIPSYKRANKQDTLQMLKDNGFSAEQIYIFVQTKEDYELYSNLYSSLCKIVFMEANSISKARNNILDYFNKKENLLMMDDDISVISTGSKNNKFTELDKGNLCHTIVKMFEYTQKNHGYLFGMYPVYNEFFMSESVSTKVTVNTIIGFPKGFPYKFDESFIAKEDIELCGRILKQNGRIFRFNNLAYKAKHRTNSGGANDVWKTNENQKAARRLSVMYPDIFSVQKNNPQEVRLIMKDAKMKGVKWI